MSDVVVVGLERRYVQLSLALLNRIKRARWNATQADLQALQEAAGAVFGAANGGSEHSANEKLEKLKVRASVGSWGAIHQGSRA